jgi:hypothetical protein
MLDDFIARSPEAAAWRRGFVRQMRLSSGERPGERLRLSMIRTVLA